MRTIGEFSSHLRLLGLVRFVISGGISAGVYYLAAWVVVNAGGGPIALAGLVGYLVAMPVAYGLHRIYSFRSRGKPLPETSRFLASSMLGTILSTGAPDALQRGGFSVTVALLLTCVIVPVVNYLLLSRWVFTPIDLDG